MLRTPHENINFQDSLLLEVSVHVNVCDFEIVGFCPREILSEICKHFQFVNTTNVINYILGRL
jgi:hypothetical protein